MEISSRHLYGTSFFKCPEAFLEGAGAEDAEGYGTSPDSTQEQRHGIICSYLQVLEDMKGPIEVESVLPCPKEQIGEAIIRELADDIEGDFRRRLEIAYVLLESFIPSVEYRVIEDFKSASRSAQQMADMGDPTSILRSAGIIRKANGENAVKLQEKIHEKMSERQLQVLKLRENNSA